MRPLPLSINKVSTRLLNSATLSFQQSSVNKGGCTFGSKSIRRSYSFAIARDIPNSMDDALTKYSNDQEPVSLNKAREQHEVYLKSLRKYVPTLCLPPLDEHPDSVFVEDTVVAIGNKAVITNPGHPSRQGEVETIKDTLIRLGMEVIDMRSENHSALCDGGDLLYTSRHLFVGLSERTNRESVEILSSTFDNVETVAVPFDKSNALHLKSIVTHIDETTLLAPTGLIGDQVLDAMNSKTLGYDSIRLPNMLACNVVSVNGGLLVQDGGCQDSHKLLAAAASERGLTAEFVDSSEIAKVDGALTCCSVLLMGV